MGDGVCLKQDGLSLNNAILLVLMDLLHVKHQDVHKNTGLNEEQFHHMMPCNLLKVKECLKSSTLSMVVMIAVQVQLTKPDMDIAPIECGGS